jgi:hypothetical protein
MKGQLRMDKLKIYMDNCCYGRPFDNSTQIINPIKFVEIWREQYD